MGKSVDERLSRKPTSVVGWYGSAECGHKQRVH